MAGRLPYMQFYPGDWIAKTRLLPAQARGCWIDFLSIAWSSETRGVLAEPAETWALVWGMPLEEIPVLMSSLSKVAIVIQRPSMVWTIASRRMVRDEIERERTRESKKPEEERAYFYRDYIKSNIPEFFPEYSRPNPARIPELSRPNPGEILEARDQRLESMNESAREGARVDRLAVDELQRIDELLAAAGFRTGHENLGSEALTEYRAHLNLLMGETTWPLLRSNVSRWREEADISWSSPVSAKNMARHIPAILEFKPKQSKLSAAERDRQKTGLPAEVINVPML